MKRFIPGFWLIACLLVFTLSCDTEGTVDPAYKNHFIKYYGGDGNQEARDFVVNADGTVVMVGTWTETSGRKRVYIVKSDPEGNVLWDKRMGGVNDEIAADIELIIAGPDAGNFIVLSNYRKNAVDSMAIRLTVISQAGDSVKGKIYNFYPSQSASSITALEDGGNGGYYLSARTTDPNPIQNSQTIENALLVRFTNNLSVLAGHGGKINSPSIGASIKVLEASTNMFYYAGYSDEVITGHDPNKSNLFFRIFLTDPSSPSSLVYSGSTDNSEYMSGIAQSLIGQFMAVGTQSNGSSNILVATRVSGNFQNVSAMQNILSNAEGVSVAASGASDFLILGNAVSGGGNRDIVLKKIDAGFGNLMTLQFGSTNNDDTGSAITELPNGDILILGTMELVNQKKMALIRVRPNGKF